MSLKLFIVDTFTTKRFEGNPTAVCLVENDIGAQHMQLIAKELNLPVTAFVMPGSEHYKIWYYTPLTAIPACGHATLGAAAVIAEAVHQYDVVFRTEQGASIQTYQRNGKICLLYFRYQMKAYNVNVALMGSLQIKAYKNAMLCSELETVFIELSTVKKLISVQPDFAAMLKSSSEIKEVVLTAAADGGPYDYALRSFCPWIGIDEDPVTGSVQAALAPYWAERLGKTTLQAVQLSEREGEINLNVKDNVVEISGCCVFVARGEFMS